MKFFASVWAISLALSIAVISAGCKSDKTSTEEAWIRQFKSQIGKVEKRFFESNYILNAQDPFYLEEVLSRLADDKTVTKVLAGKIQSLKDEYLDSWPVLTQQLERTQLIFAITAVLPAAEANLIMASSLPGGFDSEVMSLVLEFRKAVEKGTVFTPKKSSQFAENVAMDLAPQARAEVVDYANKIAARTLILIASAGTVDTGSGSGSAANPMTIKALEEKRDLIRTLNPRVASSVGLPTTKQPLRGARAGEDPLTLWKDLKITYDGIFAALNIVEEGPLVQLGVVKLLRTYEQELVKKLYSVTEEQFRVTKNLLDEQK